LKEKEKRIIVSFFLWLFERFSFSFKYFQERVFERKWAGGSYQGGHQSTLQQWKTMGSKRPLIDNVIGIKTKEVEHPPNRNGKGSWTRV
jgi:hypothetical protein